MPFSYLMHYNGPMKTQDLLKELEALGSEKVRRQNAKQGAHENQFGAKLGDIRKVAKKVKKSNPLALELWETGNIDARMLAILLMEPEKLSKVDLLELAGSIRFTRVSDWFDSYVLKRHPNKDEFREDWMNSPNPMVARSGWSLTYQNIGESPDELDLAGTLDRIENDLASSPPEVQWTMNLALTYIGVYSEELRGRAIRVGERVGLYKDYPVSKGCISPYAPVAIEERVNRKQR